nr:DUF3825 domain-containing protein [uncultured Treponema sp.]
MTLFEFAYCGNNYGTLLADLAMRSPEKWSYGSDKNNGILRNYIDYTFRRLKDEGKIIERTTYALFNTGLFDQFYKSIYAQFTINTIPNKQKWRLSGFLSEYQLTSMGITDNPERANYFDNPADLVFDTKLPIVPQYEHIFGDAENISRLPTSIRTNPMKEALFNGALENAKRMLDANYKTAIPQFYNGEIQLLLPICLQAPGVPDLALVCNKTEDKTKYLGRTCLTLEMAYNNARLIAKPESFWLKA